MPPSNQNMDELNSLDDEMPPQVVNSDLKEIEPVQSINKAQTQVVEMGLETNAQSGRPPKSSKEAELAASTESLISDSTESNTETTSPIDTSVIDSVALSDIVDDVSVGVGEIIAEQKADYLIQETKEVSGAIVPEGGDELGPTSTPEVQRMDDHVSSKGTDERGGEESAQSAQNIEATKASTSKETTNENKTGQNEGATVNPDHQPNERVVEIINPGEISDARVSPELNSEQELEIVNPGETSETEISTERVAIVPVQQNTQEAGSASGINPVEAALSVQNTGNDITKPEDVAQTIKQECFDGPPKTPEEKQKAAKDWIEKHIVTTEDKGAITQPKYVHKLVLDDYEEIPEEYSSEIILLLLSADKDSSKKLDGFYPEEEFIRSNISRLHSLDDRAVGSIIENFHMRDMVSWLLDNVKHFPSITPDRELAKRLVSSGWGSEVVGSIKAFGDVKLDAEIADMLVNSRQADVVIEHIKEFDGVTTDETLVDRLIDLGDVDLVIDNPDVFNGVVIDEEFINRSIKKNPENIVRIVEAESTPQALLNDELAKLLIEIDGTSRLFFTLDKFSPNLSNELANQITQSKDTSMISVVFKNIGKFPELDTSKILEIIDATGLMLEDYAFFINRLPESMQSEVVLNRLHKESFTPNDIKMLVKESTKLDGDVMQVLEANFGVEYVFQFRDKFEDLVLDMELANKLQAAGSLCFSIDVFPPNMHEDLVRIVCEKTPTDLGNVINTLKSLQISKGLSEKIQKLDDLQMELSKSPSRDFDGKFDEYIKILSQYFPDYESNALIIRLENDFPGVFDKLAGNEDLFLQNFNNINEEAAKVIAKKGHSWLSAIIKNHERFVGNGQDSIVKKAQFINDQIEQLDIYIRSEVLKYVDPNHELAIKDKAR